MHEDAFSAQKPAAQVLFEMPCKTCGLAVLGHTKHPKNCDACKTILKLERDRRIASTARLARGIIPFKGTMIDCADCGVSIEKTSPRHIRCNDCRVEINKIRARASSLARSSIPERRDAFNEYLRNKRATDPQVGVAYHMSTLIHRGLNGAKEGRSWRTFVPYSLQDLMTHIERQFTAGMTWANHGIGSDCWHIDHIRPKSSFKYQSPDDQSFKDCWALSNLRPLWSTENLSKSNKMLHLI